MSALTFTRQPHKGRASRVPRPSEDTWTEFSFSHIPVKKNVEQTLETQEGFAAGHNITPRIQVTKLLPRLVCYPKIKHQTQKASPHSSVFFFKSQMRSGALNIKEAHRCRNRLNVFSCYSFQLGATFLCNYAQKYTLQLVGYLKKTFKTQISPRLPFFCNLKSEAV